MTHFREFDSFEEMQKFMADSEDAAMASMGPHQRTLLGRRRFHWVRPYEPMEMFIFGEYDIDAFIANERRLGQRDGDWSEAEVQRIEDRCLRRGYLSGKAYSIVEPDGEIGDTHVSQVYEITQIAFEQARSIGWRVDQDTRTKAPVLYLELAAYVARESEAEQARIAKAFEEQLAERLKRGEG